MILQIPEKVETANDAMLPRPDDFKLCGRQIVGIRGDELIKHLRMLKPGLSQRIELLRLQLAHVLPTREFGHNGVFNIDEAQKGPVEPEELIAIGRRELQGSPP